MFRFRPCPWIILSALPTGLSLPISDPRLPKDYSSVLSMPYPFAPARPCLYWPCMLIKSLHLDPNVSRLVIPVTEYSARQDPAAFQRSFKRYGCHENLCALKQGPRSLEQHIREFLVFANHSDLPDIILIEIFCDGIHQPLRAKFRREGTRASLALFLDYALLTVGSSFTVGVAEERDTAPNCVNTATLEHAHQMAATNNTPKRHCCQSQVKSSHRWC